MIEERDQISTGKKIAFTRKGSSGSILVYVMNEDGSEPEEVARGWNPSWSPDGKKIMFSYYDPHLIMGVNPIEIFVMDADGKELRIFTTQISTGYFSSADNACWSAEGSRIVFERNDKGRADIFVVNSDGKNRQRLTAAPAWNGNPSWSPDGKNVAFQTNRDGNSEIYVIPVP